MLRLFVKEAVSRSEQVRDCLGSRDWPRMEDQAHTLKSCAGAFGALRLQVLAKDIESTCKAGDQQEAERLGRLLPAMLEDTLRTYRERFPYLSPENQ